MTGVQTCALPIYDFLGWYTEPGGGTQVTASTVFTADATLYAHWSAQSGGGNSGGGSSGPVLPSTDASNGWPNIREEIGGAEAGDAITVDMNGATEPNTVSMETPCGSRISMSCLWIPVSYTPLDVYKRQPHCIRLTKRKAFTKAVCLLR